MEWNAAYMTEFLDDLSVLNDSIQSILAADEVQEEEAPVQQKTAMQKIQAELSKTKMESSTLWSEFREQTQEMEEQIQRCQDALGYLNAARQSILCAEQYEKHTKGQSAAEAIRVLRDGLHFTPDDVLESVEVFAKLANAINQAANHNEKKQLKNRCIEFTAYAERAKTLLEDEIQAKRTQFAQQIVTARETAQNQQNAFADAITEIWENAKAETPTVINTDTDQKVLKNKIQLALRDAETEFTMKHNPSVMLEKYCALFDSEPSVTNWNFAKNVPSAWTCGMLQYDTKNMGLCDEAAAFLQEKYSFLCSGTVLQMPLCLPYNQGMNTVFRFAEGQPASRIGTTAVNAIFQMMMTFPLAKLNILRIDTTLDYEAQLSIFNQLVEPTVPQSNVLVHDRVWTKAEDINARLNKLDGHRSSILANVLQGRTENLMQYNKANPQHQQGYHLIVAILDANKPESKLILPKLEMMAKRGPESGVFTMVFELNVKDMRDGNAEDKNMAALLKDAENHFLFPKKESRVFYHTMYPMKYKFCWKPLIFPTSEVNVQLDFLRQLSADDKKKAAEIRLKIANIIRDYQMQVLKRMRDGIFQAVKQK